MRNLWYVTRGVLVFIYLFVSIFVLNALQVLSMMILPLAPRLCRRLNESFAFLWWGSIVVFLRRFYGMTLSMTGDMIPKRESSIVIANHQSMVDIPILLCFAFEKNILGAIKWCVKDAMRYVPGVGWGMMLLGMPFLSRDWSKDHKRMTKVFDRLLRDRMPFWLLFFIEGTRFSEGKVQSSQKYCRRVGRPELQHVLAPRVKGFIAAKKALGEAVDAIYDVTLGFPGVRPNLADLFFGRVPAVHLHVRRFPLAEVPQREEQLNEWLWKRSFEKDELLKRFYQDGNLQ